MYFLKTYLDIWIFKRGTRTEHSRNLNQKGKARKIYNNNQAVKKQKKTKVKYIRNTLKLSARSLIVKIIVKDIYKRNEKKN